MREILFRGKRKDNGEWVYGAFYKEPYSERDLIIAWNSFGLGFNEEIQVYRETVGQFTGMTDKNGNNIFEGDYWLETNGDYLVYVVEFRDGQFGFVCYGITGVLMPYGYDETAGGFDEIDFNSFTDFYMDKIEIIGNIHDNPELLKWEEK